VNIHELIAMLRNRLAYNEQQRSLAAQRGDIQWVAMLDIDSATTSNTLSVLEAAAQT